MKRTLFPLGIMFAMAALILVPGASGTSTYFVLKGRILDAGGKPVEGGEVFVYDSIKTRRPADFISPKTERDGLYRIEIPAGTYWVVARVRNGAKYGPLAWGGKHSGEAVEVEAAPGGELPLDFTVTDVREMARDQHKEGEGYRRVAGRLLDREGKPVRGGYAFARRDRNGSQFPDFISPWSDEEGGYTLFLPPGKYCLGGSIAYPPKNGAACQEFSLDSARTDITNDLHLDCHTTKGEDGKPGSTD